MRCECQKQKALKAKLEQIPKRFRYSTFTNYQPTDDKQAEARAQMANEITKSYFVFGPYARGKTHLATAQYVRLVQIEKPCLFLGMAELLSELRHAEMDPDYYCVVRHRVRYADSFHLFIDDIDKFKTTDFKFEVLFDLFDTLYRRNLGLTVTSNYNLAHLSESQILHPSVVRRIDDMCQAVEL